MSKVAKIGSVIAAVGFLAVAIGKGVQGEVPNLTEVTLALTTIAAAFGFQLTGK